MRKTPSRKKKILISRKFKIDVVANFLSLAFLCLSGIIVNILIARYYGAKTLGIFNEIYAIYILASQLAAFSIHLSVQKYLAERRQDKEINQIITSGLFLVLIFGSIVGCLAFFTRTIWGYWFHSQDVVFGVGLISFGLVFFALNKTLMAVLNGFRSLKSFAFFQGLRYFLILVFIISIIIKQYPMVFLPAALSLAEVILFIILFFYCLRYFSFIFSKKLSKWLHRHIVFGYHALLGNVLLDVNTRVDIIILGFFVSQELVGIYSFAAIIAEGFNQLLIVLKINVNPILARLAVLGRGKLQTFINHGRNLTYQYFSVLAFFSIIIYPALLKAFVGKNFFQSWFVFSILLGGISLSAGYQPFQMLLAQAGFPKYYSLLIVVVFLCNLILNFLFIPVWGIYGSAFATALSFIISAIILKILTKNVLQIKI